MKPGSFILVAIVVVMLPYISAGQADMEDIVVGKYRIIHSEILDQDRRLYVKLPDNYESSNEAYPVVFQLYSHFIENYYLPAVRVTKLMAERGEAPEMIVIGIRNQTFRYRDLLPEDHWGGKSEIDNYLNFFEKELIPFVASEYRTQNYRILSGPQAGAAFGIYALSERPELFNAFILGQPFWITSSRETLLKRFAEAIQENDYTDKFLMITYGKNPDPDQEEALDRFTNLVEEMDNPDFTYVLNNIPPQFDFTDPVDLGTGMKTLFKDYKFPSEDGLQDLMEIEEHFSKLSEKLGYKVKISEIALVREGDEHVREGNYEKALEIFTRMNKLYPDGLMGYDRLGNVYYQTGELERSIEYYQMFLDREPGDPRVSGIIEKIRAELGK